MIWVSKGLLTLIWYPDCYAATQLPQSSKYSKSADLLRKSLLSHIWRVPSSKALSCKHERLFDLLTLVSYDVGVKRSFAPNWCLRIAPLQSSSRNSINIRNPLIYCVNRCCLRSASVGAKRTSTGCSAPHVWRVPSSKALSCKHERLFDLLTLASSRYQG